MPVQKPLSIGQFSQMTRLSTRALRLYDEMGVLKPARVDAATGYRYYLLEQAHRADLIRQLRAVEMPLVDIRRFLDSEEEASSILAEHRTLLKARMASVGTMVDAVDKLLDDPQPMISDVVVTEQQSRQICIVRLETNRDKIAGDIANGFAVLGAALDSGQLQATGVPMLIYHDVIDEENSGVVEVAVPVATGSANEDNEAFDVRLLSGGTIAGLELSGSYTGLTAAYQKLFRWIHQHGYQLAGPPRELYLNDPATVAESDLVTQIEFPVSAGTETND